MNFLLKAVAYVLRHEAYLFFALLAFFLPLAWVFSNTSRWARGPGILGAWARALAVVLLAGFCWMTFQYLVTPVFFEHVEPQVPEVSWYYLQGHPLYSSLDSAQVYNLPYGPALYLLVGWSNELFGPALLAGKLPGVLANVATLVVLYFVFKKQSSVRTALLAVGLSAAFFLRADANPITGRSDSLLCLLAALGLWLASGRRWYAPFIVGALIGVAVNFKIHAALYFIPVAAVAWQSGYTIKQGLAAVGCALAVFFAPFVLLPNISLTNYLGFIRAIVHHGFSPIKFQQLMWCLAVVSMPLVAGWLVQYRETRAMAVLRANAVLIAGFLGAFVLLLVPASKYGAGPHHLMPWLVAVPYLGIQLYNSGLGQVWNPSGGTRWARAFLIAWTFACLTSSSLALIKTHSLLKEHSADGARVVADVQQVLKEQGKECIVLMGVGGPDDYWLTSYRCLLAFDGQPVGIDWTALMDHKRADLPEPEIAQLLQQFKTGSTAPKGVLWLIPKNSAPFSIKTFYPPYDALFSPRFLDDFNRLFKHTGSSEFFDLYSSADGLPLSAAVK